ncbi:MAG: DUF1569 domain-containing protein [Thermoanaerobaculia bacterium]|nr:DUF1569 domain-containing protein [Thermoanaerobaculia bacterium]
MPNLLAPVDRAAIAARVNALDASSTRRWGTMSVEAMLAHVSDQLRFATRELQPNGPRGPLTWVPVQWFAIVIAPWPKGGLDASRELLQTAPAPIGESRAELLRLVEKFATEASRGDLGPHPMFGHLSRHLWCRLASRHLDHHLRQFGA